MNYKEALEIQNMFTTAAQIAKARNKYEYHLKINEAALIKLLKKAFPKMKDDTSISNFAREILSNN